MKELFSLTDKGYAEQQKTGDCIRVSVMVCVWDGAGPGQFGVIFSCGLMSWLFLVSGDHVNINYSNDMAR